MDLRKRPVYLIFPIILGMCLASCTRSPDKVEQKMTNGIYEESKPMGDTKFLEYGKINPQVAETWRGVFTNNFLSDITWELASSLGYQKPVSEIAKEDSSSLVGQRQAARNRREYLEQSRQRRQQIRK